MLNYEVDPAILRRCVPRGTELDSWGGRTYVSVVGFLFLDAHVLGVPIPFHRDFEELNLRFYVRRKAGREIRRGVVFVKEIVPRAAIAWVARNVYNENYVAMPMRHHVRLPDATGDGRVEYVWQTGSRWNRAAARIAGAPVPTTSGSHEERCSTARSSERRFPLPPPRRSSPKARRSWSGRDGESGSSESEQTARTGGAAMIVPTACCRVATAELSPRSKTGGTMRQHGARRVAALEDRPHIHSAVAPIGDRLVPLRGTKSFCETPPPVPGPSGTATGG